MRTLRRRLWRATAYQEAACWPGIIAGNGTRLACEETVPNSGKSHSAVRHGFAGRGLQYVPGLFSEPAGCAGPDEQVPEWKERSGACGAAFCDSAPRQLAAHIRFPAAPRSEPLGLGASRLGWDIARRLTGDEAHHGRHPPDLR